MSALADELEQLYGKWCQMKARDSDFAAFVSISMSTILVALRSTDALAVPRILTKPMLDAGWKAVGEVTNGSNHLMNLDHVWIAMYDAAQDTRSKP